jgi:predicted transcriptional regulator
MKLLLYCTKAKPQLFSGNSIYNQEKIFSLVKGNNQEQYEKLETLKCLNNLTQLNGKIVGECDYEVEKIKNFDTSFVIAKYLDYEKDLAYTNAIAKDSCLNYYDLKKYLGTKNGYANHIKNLNIFDKPKELQEYATLKKYPGGYEKFVSVERAPQNMMYVYDVNSDNPNEKKVLISIRPEWLCKILNKEKTIEVRRVVLKEMLK